MPESGTSSKRVSSKKRSSRTSFKRRFEHYLFCRDLRSFPDVSIREIPLLENLVVRSVFLNVRERLTNGVFQLGVAFTERDALAVARLSRRLPGQHGTGFHERAAAFLHRICRERPVEKADLHGAFVELFDDFVVGRIGSHVHWFAGRARVLEFREIAILNGTGQCADRVPACLGFVLELEATARLRKQPQAAQEVRDEIERFLTLRRNSDGCRYDVEFLRVQSRKKPGKCEIDELRLQTHL